MTLYLVGLRNSSWSICAKLIANILSYIFHTYQISFIKSFGLIVQSVLNIIKIYLVSNFKKKNLTKVYVETYV